MKKKATELLDEIQKWQADDGEGYESAIDLVLDAKEFYRVLTKAEAA